MSSLISPATSDLSSQLGIRLSARMVTEFNNKNNSAQIRKLIEVLATDYATSRDANKRKGALIGLAATGLGLGKVFGISHRHRSGI